MLLFIIIKSKKYLLQKKARLRNGKVLKVICENFKARFCANHFQAPPVLPVPEGRLREDGYPSIAAQGSFTFAGLFHCSIWKPWEFAVAMSRVPGIRQGRLPGVVCVSRQETRRVWRPTWQVGAALATCLLSVRALSKSSHSQCFLCVRSAFSGKKKERKNKKLFWKVCSQHSA